MDKDTAASVGFLIKHGGNTTDRIVPDLLRSIANLINKSEIEYNGRKCKLRQLGEPRSRDGGWRFTFDVLNPDDTFDHVEFTITKTGWGRMIAPPAQEESNERD